MSGYLLKFKQTYSVKIGGRRYPVVKIGNQLWMAENLQFADNNLAYTSNYKSTGNNYSIYNNDESLNGYNGRKLGYLYNWNSVNYFEQNKETLFPSGWRVISISDINYLLNYYDFNPPYNTIIPMLGCVPESWCSSKWNGENITELNYKPSGTFGDRGFNYLGISSSNWTCTSYNSSRAYFFSLNPDEVAQYGVLSPVSKLVYRAIRLVKSLE